MLASAPSFPMVDIRSHPSSQSIIPPVLHQCGISSIVMASLSTYLPAISYGTAAPGLMVSLALYAAALVIYRLFFSPLAGFPGPKMAAATGYYESYYDMILKGQYVFKIKEMHQTYGQFVWLRNQRPPQHRPINEAELNRPHYSN